VNVGTGFDTDLAVPASPAVREVAGGLAVDRRSLMYTNAAGEQVDSGHFAIVRAPTDDDKQERVFGVVDQNWTTVDYVQVAEGLDKLSETYRVATAGVLRKGATCFVTFEGPQFDVSGDEMRDYFVANLSNQPGRAHKVMATPERIECENTEIIAESLASLNLAIPHTSDAEARIRLAGDLVAQFREMTTRIRETFELFAATPLSTEGLDTILRAAFPNPTLPAELRLFKNALSGAEEGAIKDALGDRFDRIVVAQEKHDQGIVRARELRSVAGGRFEAFEPSRLGGTIWAGYNAVTEMADWRKGRNADESLMWGSRAQEKSRAFTAALQLANN